MAEPKVTEQHGSRIITALEHAWAAIQDTHPDVPDAVIVTGAGSNQKGTPEGYQLRGHHWPERWVLSGQDQPRTPELFIAGELLAAGGWQAARRAVAVRLDLAVPAQPGTRSNPRRDPPPAPGTGEPDPYGRMPRRHASVAPVLARHGKPGFRGLLTQGGQPPGAHTPTVALNHPPMTLIA